MKRFFTIALMNLVVLFAIAQNSPYVLTKKNTIPTFTVSTAVIGSSFLLRQRKQPLSEATISALDRNDVNAFDRHATYNWSTRAAHWSDGLMFVSMATPLLLLAGNNSRSDYGKVATISAEVFLVNTALTFMVKELVKRKRPFTYNPDAPLDKKLKRDANSSFFSGHTSTTAAMSFSFAQMHSDYYPDSRMSPFIWFSAATLPLAVGILRNRAGKHFWTDILVGYAVGAATGILIPRIHRVNGFRSR
jgi:membrane-associated phospholipid phosphatase